jgi:peptide/nickel transport system substrate-binding protein
VVLVRNGAWEPETDDLRAALPDRIEIEFLNPPPQDADVEELAEVGELVETGGFDLVLDPLTWVTKEQADRYRTDAELRSRVLVSPVDLVTWISMNLGTPPFDDLYVRTAMNLAVDRPALLGALAAVSSPFDFTDRIVTHVAPDALVGNLLDPYGARAGPDRERARVEMARSRYDVDGDGRCDRSCSIEAIANPCLWFGGEAADAALSRSLAAIGLEVTVRYPEDCASPYAELGDPEGHVQLGLGLGWGKDYPNASNFIELLFLTTSTAVGPYDFNPSLLGATSAQLRAWGYEIDEVPSVDDRIERCVPLSGLAQTKCWAELDRYLMEEIVPWVPLTVRSTTWIFSERVVDSSFDQFTVLPALDRFELADDLSPGS